MLLDMGGYSLIGVSTPSARMFSRQSVRPGFLSRGELVELLNQLRALLGLGPIAALQKLARLRRHVLGGFGCARRAQRAQAAQHLGSLFNLTGFQQPGAVIQNRQPGVLDREILIHGPVPVAATGAAVSLATAWS